MAITGTTLVVMCLTMAINIEGAGLKQSDPNYKVREENLDTQVKAKEKRTEGLKEYKIHVKTKQYAEEAAKEKLDLVSPDGILLEPTE